MDEYKLLSKSESNVCNLRECISLNTFSWENLTDVYGMQFTHYQLIVHWVPSSKVHIQSQVNVQDIVQHSAFLPIVVITKFFVFINMLRMVGGKDILYYARLIAFMTYLSTPSIAGVLLDLQTWPPPPPPPPPPEQIET